MPIAHVEESWQMAEFYSNKVFLMHARCFVDLSWITFRIVLSLSD